MVQILLRVAPLDDHLGSVFAALLVDSQRVLFVCCCDGLVGGEACETFAEDGTV